MFLVTRKHMAFILYTLGTNELVRRAGTASYVPFLLNKKIYTMLQLRYITERAIVVELGFSGKARKREHLISLKPNHKKN